MFQASFSSFPSGFTTSSAASLKTTDDSFQATLDVREYSPEDLKVLPAGRFYESVPFQVSVIGQQIIIEGTTPEKTDELGQITRSFIRKFALPPQVQPEAVTSNLTSEGVLSIVALPPKPKVTFLEEKKTVNEYFFRNLRLLVPFQSK